jgi:hypothetical protein
MKKSIFPTTALAKTLAITSLLLTSCGVGPEILSSPVSQSPGTSGQNGVDNGPESDPPPEDTSPPVLDIDSNPALTVEQWIQHNITQPTPLVFSAPDAETAKSINKVVAAAQLKISNSIEAVIRDNVDLDPNFLETTYDKGIKIFVAANHTCSNQQVDEVLTEKGIKEVNRYISEIIDDEILPVSTMSSGQLINLLNSGKVVTMNVHKAISPECFITFMIHISSIEEYLKSN